MIFTISGFEMSKNVDKSVDEFPMFMFVNWK